MRRPRRKTGKQRTAPAQRPGYEASDVSPRGVLYAGLMLFAAIAVSAGLVAGLLALLGHGKAMPEQTALEQERIVPPWPRLELDGKADRATVEAAALRMISGYAWVDRQAGTARIPIERAMQLLAARGWPDAQGTTAP